MKKIAEKGWIAYGIILLGIVVAIVAEKENKITTKSIFAMDTYMELTACGRNSEKAIVAAEEEIYRLDALLSTGNKASEVAILNRDKKGELSEDYAYLLKRSKEIWELTQGAFDITVAPLVHAWGFGKKTQDPKAKEQDINIDSLKALVGYEKIHLENHRIVKDNEHITLDASAIAKGYACDVVADLLRQNGCNNLLVDIGGEVVLQGVNQKGEAWRVGISRPKIDAMGMEKELQEVIASNDLCMATSGNYLQYYFVDGQRRSHTIDPRTGRPVQHSLLSATVIASSGMRADALATACMVLGEAEAIEMINHAEDAACYLIVAEHDTLRVARSQRWPF